MSGPGGTGEYFRCLVLADAIRQRWPDIELRFVLNRHAGFVTAVPYPVDLIDASPTRSVRGVVDAIERQRPRLVVFDSAGRRAQYRAARRAGARIVYVSSREKARWRGFRWRRMSLVDEHWIVQPDPRLKRLSWLEKLKCRAMPRVRVLLLDTLFRAPEAEEFAALSARLGVDDGRYALFCPGGGGSSGYMGDPGKVYLEAARRFTRESAIPAVCVVGPNARAEALQADGVRTFHALPNSELLSLIEHAMLAVVNGGSLLPQALALGQACVAAPVVTDQDDRIRRVAQRGAVVAAALDVIAISDAALQLARNPGLRAVLQEQARALGLRNGIDRAMEEVERLLNLPPSKALE
ncbi:MAG: hypothetical protein ABR517_05785 [Thermoanaerobaculia bacterium]